MAGRYLVVATKMDKLKLKRKASKPEAHPERIFGRDAVLGHHRPGSEGNLASDLENQEQVVTPRQTPKAAPETPSQREAAKRERTAPPEH